MKTNTYLILAVLLIAVSCAHHNDVRPGAEGVHIVNVQASDTEDGARDAIRQAHHFCETRGKQAAFVSEDKKYTGDMDEANYKTAKRVSRAAQVVGGGVWALGDHKRTKNVGGMAGLGGSAVDQALGDGYTVNMKFKCL